MRIFKLALISFVFFFLLFTLISLMVPSQVRISKAINIGAPKNGIQTAIKNTNLWHNWHPGYAKSLSSTAQLPQIKPVLQNDSLIEMNLIYRSGKTIKNGWQLYQHSGTDSITLQWYMDFNLKWYPWQKFGSLFYENTYGAMMQQGLTNLKTFTEKGTVEQVLIP